MLDKLTREDFEKCVGETFKIELGEHGEHVAKLTETFANEGESEDRQPFSILFHCRHPAAPQQGMYKVSHPEFGELELFLVPIKGDSEGVVLEAVFS